MFHEAQDVIPVDDGKMANTIRWILRHQSEAGAFSEPPNGKVLHTAMQVNVIIILRFETIPKYIPLNYELQIKD